MYTLVLQCQLRAGVNVLLTATEGQMHLSINSECYQKHFKTNIKLIPSTKPPRPGNTVPKAAGR